MVKLSGPYKCGSSVFQSSVASCMSYLNFVVLYIAFRASGINFALNVQQLVSFAKTVRRNNHAIKRSHRNAFYNFLLLIKLVCSFLFSTDWFFTCEEKKRWNQSTELVAAAMRRAVFATDAAK